ncbi:SDR family NAD(P)-dependent oxidoreductase [Pararhodobacter sp.]|uniref:SDR family NAD(P)-dependent oxidoreductase n=1 Tax=Pararhodobacter sp. TaxID=2127056 RepID=UPI002FDD60EF
MQSMDGRVVVVIGGTGSIGAATAKRFAEAGATVCVTQRARPDRALSEAGFRVYQADVADTQSLTALRGSLEQDHGRIDLLVHASGFTRAIAHADLDALTDAVIDDMLAVNWRGQFATLRELAPLLRKGERPLSVFISSISGMNGIGSNIAYCAAKAGIDVMVKSLARALAPDIRVMGVAPGVVDNSFVPGRDKSASDKIAASVPLRRIATPEDIADAIFACDTALGYATGTTLVMDGGRLL